MIGRTTPREQMNYFPLNTDFLYKDSYILREIVPPRFELGSLAPKAKMIDRYTTGLVFLIEVHKELTI